MSNSSIRTLETRLDVRHNLRVRASTQLVVNEYTTLEADCLVEGPDGGGFVIAVRRQNGEREVLGELLVYRADLWAAVRELLQWVCDEQARLVPVAAMLHREEPLALEDLAALARLAQAKTPTPAPAAAEHAVAPLDPSALDAMADSVRRTFALPARGALA